MIAPAAVGCKRLLGGLPFLEYLDHVIVTWFGLFDGEAHGSGDSRVKRIE
jgi:hypothetical protein